MHSDRLTEKTRWAAAFNTVCSQSCSWHDIPARTELQYLADMQSEHGPRSAKHEVTEIAVRCRFDIKP